MSDAVTGTGTNLVTLYPTSLSDNFEARGGSEYHILQAIDNIKENLDKLEGKEDTAALKSQMDWIVTQLGNLAFTAGIEASGEDIEEIVQERIADRDYTDAIERKTRGL